jgi:prepilin-type N-terminal cleavage/methylation domain-containing protein
MRKPRSAVRGFTLIEILIVVAIIGLIVAIAVPSFVKARARAQSQICIENLAQIESAKQIWGVENGKVEGNVPTVADLIGTDRYMRKMPACPGGGTYDFQAIGRTATCTLEGHTL